MPSLGSSEFLLGAFFRAVAVAAVAIVFTFVLFKLGESVNPYAFEHFYYILLLEGILMCLGAVSYEASRERLHHMRTVHRSPLSSATYAIAGVLLLIVGFACLGAL